MAFNQTVTFSFKGAYEQLLDVATETLSFYASKNGSNHDRNIVSLTEIVISETENIARNSKLLVNLSKDFDFDQKCSGNGLKTLAKLGESAVQRLLQLYSTAAEKRSSLFFRVGPFVTELQCFVSVLLCVSRYMQLTAVAYEQQPCVSLFPPFPTTKKMKDFQESLLILDNSCFYGRANGFYFHPTLERVFKATEIVKLGFHAAFVRGFKLHDSIVILVEFLRHLRSPEKRARKIAHLIRNGAAIDFTKYFWDVCERGVMIPILSLVSAPVCVNKVFTIEAKRPQVVIGKYNQTIEIKPPQSATINTWIQLRLISKHVLLGMSHASSWSARKNLSDDLTLHCHGGGFCANSSKTHQTYLRLWAQGVACPILSIDYSLAPANPYPYALEEVLYVYAWALNNANSLGWSGKNFIMAGDSAGANIVTVVTMRALELGIARIPRGLVLFYGGFLFQHYPSPSRILLNVDPIVNLGTISVCMDAYYATSASRFTKFLNDPGKPLSGEVNSSKTEAPKWEGGPGIHITNGTRTDRANNQTQLQKSVSEAKILQDHEICHFTRHINREPCWNPAVSPLCASNKLLEMLPPTYLKVGDLDPALDDSVSFAKRLRDVGVSVSLEILEGLPHGYLMYGWMGSKECQLATEASIETLVKCLRG